MPRRMPPGLMTWLGRKDKNAKSHTTLEIGIATTEVTRNYYFASSALSFSGLTWKPLLKQGSQIRSSLTRASDSATVELHNADTEIGKEFLSIKQALDGAAVKVGRFWEDLDSAITYHKVFLTGVIVGLRVDENAVQITAISEPYAQVSVGASRRVDPSCQWEFRSPLTCGYAGSLLTCNFLLNHSDGCQGRHGDPLKFAKFGGFAFLSAGSRLKTI